MKDNDKNRVIIENTRELDIKNNKTKKPIKKILRRILIIIIAAILISALFFVVSIAKDKMN